MPTMMIGMQDRHLLAREAAFAGLAAAPARLAIQLPLPLPALENEGLVRLDDTRHRGGAHLRLEAISRRYERIAGFDLNAANDRN